MRRRSLIAFAATSLLMVQAASAQQPADPQNTLLMELKNNCQVTIRLRPDLAPKMVAQVKTLVKQGFYNNTPFHRVIDGFMAQGGDPTGTGRGGSSLPDVPAEFTNRAHFIRGVVGAARSSSPDSANSQFFIMFGPSPALDGNYTIFGDVTSGMNCVDNIKRGVGSGGTVTNPDRIIKMSLAADPKP